MTSILYTDTFQLIAAEPHEGPQKTSSLSIDMTGILIGIAPVGHMLGYTAENNANEDLVLLGNDRSRRDLRYRSRVPWKFVVDASARSESQGRKVHLDAEELASVIFDAFVKMFPKEDSEQWFESFRKLGMITRTYYSHWTCAALIQLAMQNITTDWPKFNQNLFQKIAQHESPCELVTTKSAFQLQLILNRAMSILGPGYAPAITFLTLVVPVSKSTGSILCFPVSLRLGYLWIAPVISCKLGI